VIPNGQLPAAADEVMTVVAARQLSDGDVCFVGIGLPSLAANLARRLHAPNVVLIYESGAIGAKPTRPPLSIGDGELAATADAVVSVPEIFAYWLQAGRIDIGFLGAAQIDRYGNINTTVIGDYRHPTIRLPGAGGAPEIASSARETIVILRQSRRTFVDRLDFRTSVGYLDGGNSRTALGMPGRGPTVIITDLGVLRPDPASREFVLVAVHPEVTPQQAVEATGWPLKLAPEVAETEAPTPAELHALRSLGLAGGVRHRGAVVPPVAPTPPR
jgi:glutaconate CoA-transferase subunit B